MDNIGKRRVLFNTDEKSIKKIVDKLSKKAKPFDYLNTGKGEEPYCYIIRKFAFAKNKNNERPYHDPDDIIATVIEQELARFVQENLWSEMHDAKKFRAGKISAMPKTQTSAAALELYDAYLFFTKKRDKLAKESERMLFAWSKMLTKERKEVEKEFKAKGLPVKGYEDFAYIKGKNGKQKKVKIFKSPFTEVFNRKHPKAMTDAFDKLQKFDRKLAEEEMKHYSNVIKNLRHLWI